MKLFYAVNLTERTLCSEVLPWDFKPTESITAQIRGDKQSRQEWYQNPATKHYFYTGIESANPNQRASKTDNPPRFIHAFATDYDVRIPPERVNEAITAMKIKPSFVERSLGGNVRLVWTLPRPIPVENYDFCAFLLRKAIKWLNLGLLPGLDESAFTDPTRLLCNGCEWASTKFGDVPENELQAFFVACGQEFRFKPADVNEIPLDLVEKAIVEKFPGFAWPVDFAVDTQGPSFWIAGSTSPQSAIVKKDGMFTFSAHADKPFYAWSDILGAEFVKQFVTDSLARATKDIWWDGKHFWRKIGGVYASMEKPELLNFFQVECRLVSKPGKSGDSQVDLALNHIFNAGRVYGCAPFIFRPSGRLEYQGKPVLNTYVNRVMPPADLFSEWGKDGKFPFLSMHLERMFDPPEQVWFFLAWWKHFYESAHTQLPMPGQNVFLMGGANVGKTLTNRGIVGRSVGGFMDAAEFLIHNAAFNSELFEVPLWSVDDETMGESSATQNNFHAMLKKTAANQQFKHNKKFEVACMTEWMGRIICTTNLDYVSSRALGSMDNTSMDKTNIFRCASESKIVFPNRHELGRIIETELPYLLRWMLDWNPPDFIERDVRYGYKAKHESSLLDKSHQGSRIAPFKEILIESLSGYFKSNSDPVWRGTVTQLIRLFHSNPLNDIVLRSLRLEQINRYLEMIQREDLVKCFVEMGEMKTRVWVFPRFIEPPASPAIAVEFPNTDGAKFTK